MKKLTRILGLLMALIMTVCLLPVLTSAAPDDYRGYDWQQDESGIISFKINVGEECTRFDAFLIASDAAYGFTYKQDYNSNCNLAIRNDEGTASDGTTLITNDNVFTISIDPSKVKNVRDISSSKPYVWICLRPCSYNGGLDGEDQSVDSCLCLGKWDSLENFKNHDGKFLAHDHAGELVAGKAPKEKEPGYKDYYICNADECGRLFEDEECKIEITDFDEWIDFGGRGYIPMTTYTGVWVNGKELTTDDLTVSCGSGTAVLDITTDPYTLTLTNAQITEICHIYINYGDMEIEDGAIVSLVPLEICAEGINTIDLSGKSEAYGILTDGSLTLNVSGYMNIENAAGYDGISVNDGGFTLESDGILEITAGETGIYSECDINIEASDDIEINSEGCGIDGDDVNIRSQADIIINAGNEGIFSFGSLNMEMSGDFVLSSSDCGIYSIGTIDIENTGEFNIEAKNDGIFSQYNTEINTNGKFTVNAGHNGLNVENGGMYLDNNGDFQVNADTNGVYADAVNIFGSGPVKISAETIGIYSDWGADFIGSGDVTINGGENAVFIREGYGNLSLDGSSSRIEFTAHEGHKAIYNLGTEESKVIGFSASLYTVTGAPDTESAIYTLDGIPVWVNGEQFSKNKLSIDCGDGTAQLDMTTSPYTLTLKDAQITEFNQIDPGSEEYWSPCGAIMSFCPVTISVEGQNKIEIDDSGEIYSILVQDDFELSGEGSLDIDTPGGIYVLFGDLNLKPAGDFTSKTFGPALYSDFDINIGNSGDIKVVSAESYAVYSCGDVIFSGSGAVDITSTYAEGPAVYLESEGNQVLLEGTASPIKITAAEGCKAVENDDTGESPVAGKNFSCYEVTGAPEEESVIYTLARYPIWVNGEQFSFDGSAITCGSGTAELEVSDGTYTLILNNAEITDTYVCGEYGGAIYSDLPLNIEVKGTNSISLEKGSEADGIYSAGDITLTGDGTLSISGGDPYNLGIWSDGNLTVDMGGDLNIEIAGYALGAQNDINLSGSGDVNADCGGIGIYSEEGNVTVSGDGSLTIEAGEDGIYSYIGSVTISGSGDVNISGGSGQEASEALSDGIFSNEETIISGSGSLKVYGSSCGIVADGVTLSGGPADITGGKQGIMVWSKGDLVISGSSPVTVTGETDYAVWIICDEGKVLLEGTASPITLQSKAEGMKAVYNTSTGESPVEGSKLSCYQAEGAPDEEKVVYTWGNADYEIIQGADSEWTKGSENGLPFTSNAPFDKFDCVVVDGNVVSAENYFAEEGSTKVTLYPAFLETLSVGEHTLDIVSTDGMASTKFSIIQNEEPTEPQSEDPTEPQSDDPTEPQSENPDDPDGPGTGDNGGMFIWLSLIIACGAIVCLIILRRRKQH